MEGKFIIIKDGAEYLVDYNNRDVCILPLNNGPLSLATCNLIARSQESIARFQLTISTTGNDAFLNLISFFSSKNWIIRELNRDFENANLPEEQME
jgi:hypothetical protein